MKAFRFALLLLAALSANPSVAQVASGQQMQRAIFHTLLLDDDMGKSRLGARSIGRFYPKDVLMTDYVAERLLQLTGAEMSELLVNLVSRHIDVIGQTENPRYREALKTVRERLADPKLRKRVDDALESLGNADAAPYIAGSVDLVKKRAEAAQLLTSNTTTNRFAFATIKQGATLSEVVNTLGAPDQLTMWRVRTEKLVLHYANAGMFLMSIDQAMQPQYVVMKAYPELLRVSDSYKGANFGVAQILGSAHGRALVQYYKAERRRIAVDKDVMYILVRRVLELPPAEHRYDVAMNEITMKELRRLRDPQASEWVRQMNASIEAIERAERQARQAKNEARRAKNERRLGRLPKPSEEVEEDEEEDEGEEGDEDDQ